MQDLVTSVIVPIYANSADDVDLGLGFVRSVRQTTEAADIELIVIDNGGALYAAELAVDADLYVRCDPNRGFAGGVNLGLKLATGRWIAVGSADIVVHPGWLEPMRRAVALHGGIVTPAERGVDETPKQRRRRAGFFGPLWMMGREVPELIGPLDEERFPLIYGDTAYAIEARAFGLRVERCWDAEITQVKRHHAVDAMPDEALKAEYDRLIERYGHRFYGHWLEALCPACRDGAHGACDDDRCPCHLEACKAWRAHTRELVCDPS